MNRILLLLAFLLLLGSCGTQRNIPSGNDGTDRSDGYMASETGSVQHLDLKENDGMSYRTLADYLQAHVTGVEVGANGRIVIRGVNSINASTDPLILMDGQEVPDPNSINPDEIYSVDVIKDGSTASYGMRGGNGVILITSKAAHHAKQAEQEARKREQEARKAARKAAKETKKK